MAPTLHQLVDMGMASSTPLVAAGGDEEIRHALFAVTALLGLLVASVVFGILLERHLRRAGVRTLDACDACGYDRTGLDETVFPECGRAPSHAAAPDPAVRDGGS